MPEIVELMPTQAAYQQAPPRSNSTLTTSVTATGGKSVDSKASPNATTGPNPNDPYEIHLNWAIANPAQIRGLILNGYNAEGTAVMPPKEYDFARGIPEDLKNLCILRRGLICQNVATGIRQVGSYSFELTVIPWGAQPEKAIARKTEPIAIQARPPRILTFQVNGETVMPKYILPVDQGQPSPEIVLSWEVENTEGTKVELLPAPGPVLPKGAMLLPLSPGPSSTVITLKVTNAAGEQIARSFTMETFDPTPGQTAAEAAGAAGAGAAGAAGTPGAAGAAAGAAGLTAPVPAQRGTLSPSELPPQF